MLDSIESAINDIRNGKMVIVVDDEERENEGDFVTAARNVTPEVINFMSKYGRGLICAPLPEDRCDELGLELMVIITPPCMKRLLRFLLTCWGMAVPPEFRHTTAPKRYSLSLIRPQNPQILAVPVIFSRLGQKGAGY
jgi:3,4-dihydroxy-2-butanone 4-phosphate synthase